jgi:hypothetical protein
MNRTFTLALITLALLLAAACNSDPYAKGFGGHDPEAGLAGTDYTPTTSPVATK